MRGAIMLSLLAPAALALSLGAAPASAHGAGDSNEAGGGDPTWRPEAGALPAGPMDLDVGGAFELVDHRGRAVSDQDFRGRWMLVYFGYARCEGICPLGLRRMTRAVEMLGPAGREVQPLLITVDPSESPSLLAERVDEVHPRLVGLTGTSDQLAAAARSYRVDVERVGKALDGTTVFRHGSYIYLMNQKGELASILPPVLPAAAMADILRRHLPTGAPADH